MIYPQKKIEKHTSKEYQFVMEAYMIRNAHNNVYGNNIVLYYICIKDRIVDSARKRNGMKLYYNQ